jgi:hypothetical protein
VSIYGFEMPGWNDYSTWGEEEGLGHLYAQLYTNSDDPHDPPLIWITPPKYMIRTVDELASAIAEAIVPFEAVPVPASIIKRWLLDGK